MIFQIFIPCLNSKAKIFQEDITAESSRAYKQTDIEFST